MTFVLLTDIPKFLTNHTIFYSWEGNPVNISCDVRSNPPATMLWRRERFTISAEATANTRVYGAEGKSVLEVSARPSTCWMRSDEVINLLFFCPVSVSRSLRCPTGTSVATTARLATTSASATRSSSWRRQVGGAYDVLSHDSHTSNSDRSTAP